MFYCCKIILNFEMMNLVFLASAKSSSEFHKGGSRTSSASLITVITRRSPVSSPITISRFVTIRAAYSGSTGSWSVLRLALPFECGGDNF